MSKADSRFRLFLRIRSPSSLAGYNQRACHDPYTESFQALFPGQLEGTLPGDLGGQGLVFVRELIQTRASWPRRLARVTREGAVKTGQGAATERAILLAKAPRFAGCDEPCSFARSCNVSPWSRPSRASRLVGACCPRG